MIFLGINSARISSDWRGTAMPNFRLSSRPHPTCHTASVATGRRRRRRRNNNNNNNNNNKKKNNTNKIKNKNKKIFRLKLL